MTESCDVLVIGAGVAGCAAALSARDQDAEVLVVESGGGATALSSGAWDVATDLGSSQADTFEPKTTLRENIFRVREQRPAHPYARLDGDPAAAVLLSHKRVLEAIGGYSELNLESSGRLIPTELGWIRRAASAQREILDLQKLVRGRVLVVGIPGLPDWDAEFIASSLRRAASKNSISFEGEDLEGGHFTRRSILRHVSEASSSLKDRETRHRFTSTLSKVLSRGSFDALLLPPVLPVEKEDAFQDELEAALGLPVGEAAVSLSALQGARLRSRLRTALTREGCTLLYSPVERVVPTPLGTRVEFREGKSIRAGATVLATGKHLGGGLRLREGQLVESLGSLPLRQEGNVPLLPSSALGFDPMNLFGPELFQGGPGYRQGVGYDEAFHPVDELGRKMAPDLFVAGALLDGFDPARDGTGLGCCTTTGFFAGKNAALQAGTRRKI